MSQQLPNARSRPQATALRRLRVDRIARHVVTAGGIGIIACIVGMLAFLLVETAPLGRSAAVGAVQLTKSQSTTSAAADELRALCADEWGDLFASVDGAGRIVVSRRSDASVVEKRDMLAGLEPRPQVREVRTIIADRGFALATTDGRVLFQPLSWHVDFVSNKSEHDVHRVSKPVFGDASTWIVAPAGRAFGAWHMTAEADTNGITSIGVAAQLASGEIAHVRATFEWNEFAEEWTKEVERGSLVSPVRLTAIALSETNDRLFGGTEDGRILSWLPLSPETAPRTVAGDNDPIRTLAFVFGQTSLVSGTASGKSTLWFERRVGDGEPELTRIRELPGLPTSIRQIVPSRRNKALLIADEGGHIALVYATTGALRWSPSTPIPSLHAVNLSPKADAILIASAAGIGRATHTDPHPEASSGALFGKVWYEGYEQPSYEWQSGGTEDFEIKISLVPLIFGTVKGTFFAMLLSIPLAVLGAMFVSQFMHPRLRAWIKPAIEIMAAMPSVILGFIAALWLAPLVETGFCALLLMLLVLPIAVVLAGMLWMKIPRRRRERWMTGSEAFLFCAAIAGGIGLCILLENPVEGMLFGGDFPHWLKQTLGIDYEQRNAVVIAIAMSFAVVPIIFSISEDALSNVPRNLVSGSLALGASRWQTVVRVVLPTASPGIFSATMVGLGRAVGETMIVLMATGNTAILDWNPFNGFRSLSANIATEIPEAPHGSTLYRTLFLAALLLFVLTFVINTLAEVVRQRLRTRYASL